MAGVLNYVFKARLREAVKIAAAEVKSEFQGIKLDLKAPLRDLFLDPDFQATVDEVIILVGDQLQERIEAVASKYTGGGGVRDGEGPTGDVVGGLIGKVMKRFLG